LNLTQKQRQYLRKLAHDLKPVAQIGKNGLGDQAIVALDQVLATQELVKVKFNGFQDEKQQLSEQMADRTDSALVAIIGNTAVLYRESRDPEYQKIVLPI